ncbi:MAG: 30S ribosomal protein S21 [Candidatus Omnitrophica bacterium]|nr:30S ribosomal protein S21 [Candidatus Omnitrophota bacterium]
MVKVVVREGQRIEDALRLFKKKCQKHRIIQDYKKSLRFEKRSDKRRREREEGKRKARRDQRRETEKF